MEEHKASEQPDYLPGGDSEVAILLRESRT